jgi:hypothetical protein
MSEARASVSLRFPLDVEDDWPPVGSESLPFEATDDGLQALVAPLFVKNLSVHDIVEAEMDEDGYVRSWRHKRLSDHSTIWLLRLSEPNSISCCLEQIRILGCNTVSLDQFGCYSIDVPGSVPINKVDEILGGLNEEEVALAYPSMRHPD